VKGTQAIRPTTSSNATTRAARRMNGVSEVRQGGEAPPVYLTVHDPALRSSPAVVGSAKNTPHEMKRHGGHRESHEGT
jgi:hypothetical protein